MDKNTKYKIMAATVCLPSQEEILLPKWISYFEQIQYIPNQLENYITKPNREDLEKNELINRGRNNIIQLALKNEIDWILFLDIDYKAEIDIVYQMLKPESPFVIKNNVIMLHKSIFQDLILGDISEIDADDWLISEIESQKGIKPIFI